MLWVAFQVPCTRKVRARTPDGEGGWKAEWADGGTFRAAIVLDSAAQSRIAEKEGATALYTVTTAEAMAFHDAFASGDGRTFRIVEVDDPAPDAATFAFRQYKAEEWELA